MLSLGLGYITLSSSCVCVFIFQPSALIFLCYESPFCRIDREQQIAVFVYEMGVMRQ